MEMEKLYCDMVALRESIKLLHFQTTNYNVHKITDQYLIVYDQLFDTFWEVKQSNKFRITLKAGMSISIRNVRTYDDLSPVLTNVIDALSGISADDPSYVSAGAIIEEAEKFKYLLTFR